MEDKLNKDLKKYEEEIEAVNKRLADFDAQAKNLNEQRQGLITHGRRIEGIVAYIRAALDPEDKKEDGADEDSNEAEKFAAK